MRSGGAENRGAPEADDRAVLLLTPIGRDADLASAALDDAGIASIICESVADLIDRIAVGSGAAVLASEALKAEDALRLQALLEHQPAWSDFPLVIFSESAGRTQKKLEPLVGLRATTVLERPVQLATFVATVRTALAGRMRQYEVRDLLFQVQARTRQLQRLALQLSETEERERHRLAQVLHDDLQQVLVAASFHVGLLRHRVRSEDATAIQNVQEILRHAIEISRNLSHELSPPALRQHGLVAGLHWLKEWMSKMHQLDMTVEAPADAEPAAMALRIFLFQCAREMLFNVVKHAGTTQAAVTLKRAGEYLRLTVRDEGCGFGYSDMKEIERNAGFGLFAIRERARLLGGALSVESATGQGAALTVAVPSETRPVAPATEGRAGGAARAMRRPKSDHGPRERPLSVVLADDHQVIRSGLRTLLAAEKGLKVVAEAQDGAEAIQLAEQLHPDVIVMDISMPNVDGLEATRRIKSRCPDIRIIGMSMFDDAEMAQKMLQAGAESYVSKAESSEKLVQAIRVRPVTEPEGFEHVTKRSNAGD